MHDPLTHKRCPRCGETKPLTEFWVHRTASYTPNGTLHEPAGRPTTYCKPCGNAYRTARITAQRERGFHPIHPKRSGRAQRIADRPIR